MSRPFYVWVNFVRFDDDENPVYPTRSKKTNLAVESLRIRKGLSRHDEAMLTFSDGTHVGPFEYNRWDPKSRPAKVAANYERWKYSISRGRKE